MNRYQIRISVLLSLCLYLANSYAQNSTLYGIGYSAGQRKVSQGSSKIIYTFSSGAQTGASDGFKTIVPDEMQVMAGMPPNVSYFPMVFGENLFVSKGYFSNYIQLQWKISALNSRIKKFYIYRKPLGQPGDSSLVATTAGDVYAWRDERADKGTLYKYTVFAQGISDEARLPYINFVESTGFVTATGTVAGRITYEGGTAVEGVNVVAETSGNLGGKSLYMNGTDAYLALEHSTIDTELELSGGFTYQTWVRYDGTTRGSLFSKGTLYELSYEPGSLNFVVGNATATLAFTPVTEKFFHVTAVFSPGKTLKLYVHSGDDKIDSVTVAAGTTPAANIDNIWIGRDRANNFWKGYVDEIRLWNKALSYGEVKRDFNRYLTGSETGIVGYWNLDAGIGDRFYDLSRKGYTFYENHGYVRRATWSTIIPTASQLSYRGVTDSKGNYSIVGFPYETEGSLYTFTPMFGIHKFEPVQALRFVGDGASVHNGIDFKDVSSFPVTGTLRYRHTKFPVEGVSLLIDGKPVVNKEGVLVVTDNLGRFTIDVPIGPHNLRVSKNQHGFEANGRFPRQEPDGSLPSYDFQSPLSGLEFIDTTLVKVAGRVAGGPVQEEIPLGFGRSTNNLGTSKIYLTSEKGYDITLSDSTKTNHERFIHSSTGFSTKFIEINPDPETGEFTTYLPPERYRITGVTAGNYVFDQSFNRTVNLETTVEENETVTDTLEAKKNGVVVPGYPPYNPADYEEITTVAKKGIVYTVGTLNFKHQSKQNFILRVRPTITVTNSTGGQIFGEDKYTYEDKIFNTKQVIPLIANGNYTFGHPVFMQRNEYQMVIDLFEEYTHGTTGKIDRVPVVDGEVEIVNDLAIQSDKIKKEVNDKGRALYTFRAGLPQTNQDQNVPANSYTKTLSITAVTGNEGATRTTWRETDPFRAFVFGAMPEGNNFVTTGPTEVVAILRDPPGSASTTSLEEGSSVSRTNSYSSSASFNQELEVVTKLGMTVETFAGLGAGVINEVSTKVDLTAGVSAEQVWSEEGESVLTTDITKTITTSDDGHYVGADGDVFVGFATNIVYGNALNLIPLPKASCQNCTPDGVQESGGFKIGLQSAMRLNPEFSTSFIFTQAYIQETLIPNLQALRNKNIVYSLKPDTLVFPANRVVYVSKVSTDASEKFGSNNDDKEIWESQASDNKQDGPSYVAHIPQSIIDSKSFIDSVRYFNSQIAEWKYWLGENERRKLAAKLLENISFDAGATYSSSKTVTKEESSTRTFEFAVSESFAAAKGFQPTKGTGVDATITLGSGQTGSSSSGSGTASYTTYGYSFVDGDDGDYMSIDVKDAKDGFSPVFFLRAGATQCPYQSEEVTRYYKPGTKLGDATLAREKVSMSVAQAEVNNVPENRPAEFTLLIANNSETKEDAWYDLRVDETTNPFGAVLEIDGQPIGNGRSFFVTAGSTLQKILKVRKGSSTVLDYEDISLVIGSQCNESVADGNRVADTVKISAHYQPGCSNIAIRQPKDQWVLNANTQPNDVLNVVLDSYDVNYGNFKYVLFQYKPSSTSQWTTERVFYNKKQVTQEDYDKAGEPKSWMEGSKIQYPFTMHSLPDRTYDLRAVSVCVLGPGVTAETPTDVVRGVKDVKRPVVFGSPQPGDGILQAGEDIAIQFDEPIEAGLLTPFNFSVKGVLNNYKLDNNTSITLDGDNDYVKVPDGLSLSRSFTAEFWLKRNSTGREAVVFAKGYAAEDAVQFGFTASNKVFLEVAGQRIESTGTYTETDWHHYAIAYNEDKKQISVYRDDAYAIDQAVVNKNVAGQGPVFLGKSVTDNRFASVNIHEFRVWSEFHNISTVYAQLYTPMTGDEIGLVGYWPMDEAYGSKALDKARSRHALVFADWMVLPRGKAFSFKGADYLTLNTASTVVISDQMDMTLEFWFKGTTGQSNVTLFSSGKGDGTDRFNAGNVSVNANSEGKISVLMNGIELTGGENVMDNNWHHLALIVQRNANATLYVDGTQKATTPAEKAGGLSGAAMWIGARGYKPSAVDVSYDRYFKGNIDEFRIWRMARKLEQVLLDRNAKLQGDEAGLVAYYPFERYETAMGVKLMKATLADQWQNPYGPNGGNAATTGAAFSDDAPNIKDARPVTNVDFDWATNVDKIIITPSASLNAIMEKSIIEITVSDVEDKYENRLASPVTWTAYVDKNPLKWDNDNLELTKKLYEPQTFTVNIVNRGGTQQNFHVKNLPKWLAVQPESGVVPPLSSVKATFTINEGLNTGYFSEDVFLEGDFGFDEKLHLDLSVFTPEPVWTVDVAKFQYSMNVIGQLKIEGIISTDAHDRVAAFVNNECRGVANLRYIEQFDMYQVYMDIYSNSESGDKIELRVWDASKGTEHRDVSPDYTFLSNALKGSPSAPELIEAGATIIKKFNLESGWNWTSFNIVSPGLKNVNTLLTSLSPATGDQIKGQNVVDVFSENIGWTGTLSSGGGFDNGLMYMIKVKNAGSFEVKGVPVNASVPIAIRTGWNWIGVNPQFNITVDEGLASLAAANGDVVKGKRAFAIYQKGLGWIGSLKYLVPGEGYLLKSSANGSLVYPETTSLSSGRTQAEDEKEYWPVDAHAHPNNMTIIARIEGSIMEEMVVGAFAGDVCKGFAVPVKVDEQNSFYFLTVQGNDSEKITFKAMNKKSGEVISLVQTMGFGTDKITGSFADPFRFTFGAAEEKPVDESSTELLVYPNPFAQHLVITLPDASQEYKLILTDVAGRIVGKFTAPAGKTKKELSTEIATLAPGMYLLNIEGTASRTIVKVIKN